MGIIVPNIRSLEIDRQPDNCPLCNNAIYPLETPTANIGPDGLERIFRCPRQECQRFFIARYTSQTYGTPNAFYFLDELLPITIKKSEHSDTINTVSPDFVAIVDEAEGTEKSGFKQVCGPGYRKALEFLIKDYVIRSHPNKAEEIKRLNLGKCISDYVSDERVKQVAARAVWLGNDETHYLRKWEGKDLNDLKALIALTVHWIEMDELTKKALNDMPEGK
jgi:hypothetical protein